jgi:hypothetical protein
MRVEVSWRTLSKRKVLDDVSCTLQQVNASTSTFRMRNVNECIMPSFLMGNVIEVNWVDCPRSRIL